MNTYSPERKAALIARMMPPHNQPVVQLARSEGIPANTLYAWGDYPFMNILFIEYAPQPASVL